ncbi:MAG TPA: hypothetical protein VMH81_32470 [Bryobacteraceae bacterium]|nr:hypothetical protein [Bryobacteraceae bacterium]
MRSPIAALLALLLSIASCVPVAVRIVNESTRACCPIHAKACCHKGSGKPAGGPMFSSRSCDDNCGAPVLAGGSMSAFVGPATAASAPLADTPSQVRMRESVAPRYLSHAARRQRPPPSPPSA